MKLPSWPLSPYPGSLAGAHNHGAFAKPCGAGRGGSPGAPSPPDPAGLSARPGPSPPGTGRGRPHLPTAQAGPAPALSPARTRTQRSALARDACAPPVRGESRSPAPQGGRPPPLATPGAPGAPGALGSGTPAEAPGGARAWPGTRVRVPLGAAEAPAWRGGGSPGYRTAVRGRACGGSQDRAAVAWGRAGRPGWALSVPLTEKETEAGEGKRRTEGD